MLEVPFDTTPDARRAQFAAYRRMTAARTAAIAAEMSDAIRQAVFERLQKQYPELAPGEVKLLLVRELHGIDAHR